VHGHVDEAGLVEHPAGQLLAPYRARLGSSAARTRDRTSAGSAWSWIASQADTAVDGGSLGSRATSCTSKETLVSPQAAAYARARSVASSARS
jgi:hypothetical protein